MARAGSLRRNLMSIVPRLLLLAFCLALMSVLPLAERLVSLMDDDPEDGAEGKPVPQGANVSLVLDKKTYFVGENVLVHFCVENVGPRPFHVSLGGDYRGASRHLRFSVHAFDAEGKDCMDPDPSGYCLGGLSHSPEVKPDQKLYESIPLPRYR